MKKQIGTRIRKLREAKDYTQDNMAAELEITAGAYAKIERGETDPSATRLLKIAEILEVDVITFFKDTLQTVKVEDPGKQYGVATRADIENILQLIKQQNKEFEKLKALVNPAKKKPSKK
ncbi:MAG: helix-turn-helix transcriptional regulator [Sediminibacterium sp.]